MRFSYLVTAALQASSTLATPGSVCYSGIYGLLLPLARYSPAQEFCSKHYPIPAVTVTAKARRHVQRSPVPVVNHDASLAARDDPLDKLCTSLQKAAASIARTACSCIETTKTVTVKPTTKSTAKATTSPKKTTAKVTPTSKASTTKKMTQTTRETTPTTKATSTKSNTIVTTTTPIITTSATTTPALTTPATTTPVMTTPVITTPVITTPVITTPDITTPVVTTPAATTSAAVLCPAGTIIAVDGDAVGPGYLQASDNTDGRLTVTTDITAASLFVVGGGLITQRPVGGPVNVGYGTGGAFSVAYFSPQDDPNSAGSELIVGTNGNVVTLMDRNNGNSIISDCDGYVYLLNPNNADQCNTITLRQLGTC